MEARTTSDLLIDLEQKVQHLSKLVASQEGAIRLILAAVNRIEGQQNIAAPPSAPPEPKPPINRADNSSSKFEQMKAMYGIEDEDSKKPKARIGISQIIVDTDDKPIRLANVEIWRDGAAVKSVRTNQVGRWNSSLDPGPYDLKVSKRNPDTGFVLTKQYRINVPVSDKPIELIREVIQ